MTEVQVILGITPASRPILVVLELCSPPFPKAFLSFVVVGSAHANGGNGAHWLLWACRNQSRPNAGPSEHQSIRGSLQQELYKYPVRRLVFFPSLCFFIFGVCWFFLLHSCKYNASSSILVFFRNLTNIKLRFGQMGPNLQASEANGQDL